ncbi:HSP20 family protein [Dethiosulfatibacter aminovorans DSM 17477]|uniref:HSP20 family protein n=1 Tax=Dethiosulfatibacter aminovorans DSM 17477 TaxID=1121476 RepID=A0A1M6BT66_9FIRM|nr:Hsp20/alpha crystallin family protein [Dethiosulfatibacter aminovorans]SHI51763.1 HSP20 family protein [Dethiosulfatibacter aminovorans DSM 17477]
MANLVPFNRRRRDLERFGFGDFRNMLDGFFSDSWIPERTLMHDTFKIDVKENENDYVVEAELPGVKKEEIDLKLNDGRLSISIKRDERIEEEEKNYIHKERRFCSMSRTVYLEDAETEGINAKLEDGLLTIMIPKKDKKDRSKRIDID